MAGAFGCNAVVSYVGDLEEGEVPEERVPVHAPLTPLGRRVLPVLVAEARAGRLGALVFARPCLMYFMVPESKFSRCQECNLKFKFEPV